MSIKNDATRTTRKDDGTVSDVGRFIDGVRHEERGKSERAPKRSQMVIECLPRDLVERRKRFVEEKKRGLHDERPCQRHPHLHSAGKLGRVTTRGICQADLRECVERLASSRGDVNPRELKRERGVFEHRAPREETCVLEYAGEFEVARPVNNARGWRVESCKQPHQGAFATAGWPKKRHK